MGRITIKDIAKLLKVNPSTVSRALKDHPDIGKETKLKIQQVAKDLGYMPNYQAIRFRQNKSGLIGLILPEMGMFFFPSLVKAVEEITKKNSYNLIIFQSNDLKEREEENVQFCQNFGIDGILICLSKQTDSVTHFKKLVQKDTPIVFFDKIVPKAEGFPTVIINDFQASFTAINHLAKKGYKKISGVFGNANLDISQRRKQGFLAALQKHQLPYYENCCFHADTLEEARDTFRLLLQQSERPDAVFSMTDETLAGIMQAIYETDIKIPQELAVISISNGNLPYYLKPQITHIRHSGYMIGKTAIELLFDLINETITVEKQKIEVETYLVELDSC